MTMTSSSSTALPPEWQAIQHGPSHKLFTSFGMDLDVDFYPNRSESLIGGIVHEMTHNIPWYMGNFCNDGLYLLVLLYILLQPPFRAFVKRTNIYEEHKQRWKVVMATYNLIMSAFSLASCVTVGLAMTELPNGLFGPGQFSVRNYAVVSRIFYYSKYVEFVDTFFLILCNRPVTWLQYNHHIGIVFVSGLWVNSEIEGYWTCTLLNGFIHTIMYCYYACAIMKWPFPCKQAITSMQLAQFFMGLGIHLKFFSDVQWWAVPLHRFAWFVNYSYTGMVIVLFANFYYQTYVNAGKKTRKNNNGALAKSLDNDDMINKNEFTRNSEKMSTRRKKVD